MTGSARPLRTLVVGAGRAGGSFARALTRCGWQVEVVHHDQIDSIDDAWAAAHRGPVSDLPKTPDPPELVLLCVPDATVRSCAAALPKSDAFVVAHCAGSLGLDVLDGHRRVASVHPLVSLADPEVGAERLVGAWFAVEGDDSVGEVVAALGGRSFPVAPGRRAAYHAAAAVASNHLVALLAEVEAIAAVAGVPLEAYLDLVRGTVDNVENLGVTDSLTGPASRGDWDTVRAHLDAIGPTGRDHYLAGLVATARLAGREVPWAVLLGDEVLLGEEVLPGEDRS